MKRINRISAVVIGVMAMFLLLPMQALAAGNIDLSHAHSLTVTAVYAQKPISGMRFDAYRISSVDECGELTVIDRYRDFADELDIRGKNDTAWQNMAQTLAREILLDPDLKPSRSAVTDADGVAKFADISMGLYLIVGNGVEKDGYVYSTSPFFVMLPEQDLSSNTWNYHVVANAKPGQEPVKADYEVIKVWKDDCHKDQRPKSIAISLICDGEVYDTITLPHNGAWSYTWKDLDTNHQWTVMEKKEQGYKDPDIQQEGNTFIVTNTCSKPTTPPQPGKPTLPQTGQLWWPVPVLIAAGLFLTAYNMYDDQRAGQSVMQAIDQLGDSLLPETPKETATEPSGEREAPAIYDQTTLPDYVLCPEMEMPLETINGMDYIGVLQIPSLELELPIASEWNYPNLKAAPCRYSGSAYLNNMIICAHNYSSHFGKLKNLSEEDVATFTDMAGNVFIYKMVERETLNPTDIEEMEDGDWDLTLFTCTVGGKTRVTIRFKLDKD